MVDLDIVKPCIKEILILVTQCHVSDSGQYGPLVIIFLCKLRGKKISEISPT